MSKNSAGLVRGADNKQRCFWVGHDRTYIKYHDTEWGQPVTNDRRLFEKICLEGFQAGLSWLTILKKRENFRRAFDQFDFYIVAHYDERHVETLLHDKGIVRHRGKIRSVINNAQKAILLVQEFGSLASYFWSYQPPQHERFSRIDLETLQANLTTPASIRLSNDLKKRGWSFVGPTMCYAFMQAMGLVQDHIDGCDFAAKY